MFFPEEERVSCSMSTVLLTGMRYSGLWHELPKSSLRTWWFSHFIPLHPC